MVIDVAAALRTAADEHALPRRFEVENKDIPAFEKNNKRWIVGALSCPEPTSLRRMVTSLLQHRHVHRSVCDFPIRIGRSQHELVLSDIARFGGIIGNQAHDFHGAAPLKFS